MINYKINHHEKHKDHLLDLHDFRVWFTLFKVIGAIILILPRLPRRVKDWAYATGRASANLTPVPGLSM